MNSELTNPTQGSYVPPASAQAPVVSVKHWILTFILCAIPIVNIIMLFVWAFGDHTNPNKKNYARASLLLAVIVIVLYIIFFLLIFLIFGIGAASHFPGTQI
ncbi:hypothetical protein SK3146_06748 [Paenibacillus konkukensis]|uniref:Uncharacterized protein n=1 Tax=Paenibacillus konkukensis TaxID=2020716 RepID=A0ABY4S146_9BACL|nr:hypothetical protein [Paenibacillus konkukensis]UQZ87446.1 hypothetical protein SK3146_06748 [Paenibacillus konkukensis]